MAILKILFWTCLVLVVYTYVGYGVLLWLLVAIKRIVKGKPQKRELPADDALPHVTFLVCAYNEQDMVDMKVENTHQLDYPKDKLHLMWVTDGSTDDTNERLRKYDDIEVVYCPERRGKTAALNHGISLVTNEITVMTDANTMVNREAIREIVRCMEDPQVACVAGEKRVLSRNEGQMVAQGEGLYWKYESTLKRLDSELYSAMGAAGELNAIRTALYQPMPTNALLDDFVMSMRMVDEGYRIAYTSEAYAMEYGSANAEEESKRKRRIAAGGLQSTWWLRAMMNPPAPSRCSLPVRVAPRATLDRHPLRTLCPDTPQHSTRIPESRQRLYHHLDTPDTLLSGCPAKPRDGTPRTPQQAALRGLLLPVYERQRAARHQVPEHTSGRRDMGESQKRIKKF